MANRNKATTRIRPTKRQSFAAQHAQSSALPVHGMSPAAWPYALRVRRIARPRLRRRRQETRVNRTSREAWSEYHCGGNKSATFQCGRGTHEDISASPHVRPCVALRLASVRQIFECRAQLVNVEHKAPVNLARLRHSTVGDQLAEFANRNTNAGGRFRLGESKHNRQRWQDVTQTAVHGFPRKTHERPHPSDSGYRCDRRSPRYPRPSLRLSYVKPLVSNTPKN